MNLRLSVNSNQMLAFGDTFHKWVDSDRDARHSAPGGSCHYTVLLPAFSRMATLSASRMDFHPVYTALQLLQSPNAGLKAALAGVSVVAWHFLTSTTVG